MITIRSARVCGELPVLCDASDDDDAAPSPVDAGVHVVRETACEILRGVATAFVERALESACARVGVDGARTTAAGSAAGWLAAGLSAAAQDLDAAAARADDGGGGTEAPTEGGPVDAAGAAPTSAAGAVGRPEDGRGERRSSGLDDESWSSNKWHQVCWWWWRRRRCARACLRGCTHTFVGGRRWL